MGAPRGGAEGWRFRKEGCIDGRGAAQADCKASGRAVPWPTLRIRVARFDVLWPATVLKEADVANAKYIVSEFLGWDLELPTPEKRAQHGLSEEQVFGGWTAPGPTGTT